MTTTCALVRRQYNHLPKKSKKSWKIYARLLQPQDQCKTKTKIDGLGVAQSVLVLHSQSWSFIVWFGLGFCIKKCSYAFGIGLAHLVIVLQYKVKSLS